MRPWTRAALATARAVALACATLYLVGLLADSGLLGALLEVLFGPLGGSVGGPPGGLGGAVRAPANLDELPVIVLVYPVPEAMLSDSAGLTSCNVSRDMYFVERVFHENLARSRHGVTLQELQARARTRRPLLKAGDAIGDVTHFYVPHYTTSVYHCCLARFSAVPPHQAAQRCKRLAASYLDRILSHVRVEYPYWNQSLGSDHFTVMSWDQGPELVPEMAEQLSRMVLLTHVGTVARSLAFDPFKDIVVPPFVDAPRPGIAGPPARCAYFRGTLSSTSAGPDLPPDAPEYSRGVRPFLASLNGTAGIRVFAGHSPAYWAELGACAAALCPPGWSTWTPRVVEALLARTVPVVFGDAQLQLPFEDWIPYSRLAVRVPLETFRNATLPRVRALLENVGGGLRRRRAAATSEIRGMLTWHFPAPLAGDAFHTALWALHSRRAARRFSISAR